VSEDLGRLHHDQQGQQMDVDEWEDIVDSIDGANGPDDNLEISHEGGEYEAVREYLRYVGKR
jgi:hypothetical protein